jgi:hypothetical protein
MKSSNVPNYVDEDLHEIARGSPGGLFDSYGGLCAFFLIFAIIIGGLGHHFFP